MPLKKKKKLFVQIHSVNLSTKNCVLFFAENWNLKVEAVSNVFKLFYYISFDVPSSPPQEMGMGG